MISALDEKPPMLVLSLHNELQIAKRVIQAGASGFVTKGSEQDILIDAVRKVAAGGRFIDPLFTEQMIFEISPITNAVSYERLSERELSIMKLVARGKTNIEIAKELFISDKTVSTYKAGIMQKMNFQSNAELFRYATDFGLIE